MSKYKVTSATPFVKMAIKYEDENGLSQNTTVHVDFVNERIFFDQHVKIPEDANEFESAIFDFLRPEEIQAPELPPEILRRIEQVKSGNYGSDVNSFLGYDR